MGDLAVTLTAFNSMRTIRRTLESVKPLASRIVVVDSGSTDGTIELCRELGAEVIHRDWEGMAKQRQFSLDQCASHRWVLSLDSDESLEPDLQASIRKVVEEDDETYRAWWINRKLFFYGGWLHHAFQPEWRLRLVRGGEGNVSGMGEGGRGGHDRIHVDGKAGKIKGTMRHDSWADVVQMAEGWIDYAKRAAEHGKRGGTIFNLLFSPPAVLIKQLVLRRGVLDGWRGWIVAVSMARAVLLKHTFIAVRKKAGDSWLAGSGDPETG
jgi:glycosyltransferase involved in cell wall biosynthesis